jgi:hypothetical protein
LYIYHDLDDEAYFNERSRSHPWSGSASDPASRYVDFRSRPDLIEESLEDFRAFSGRPAIRKFYNLVRLLNGPKSTLETNDTGFRGPYPNPTPQVSRRLETRGRLTIFYRDLSLNTSPQMVQTLCNSLVEKISIAEPKLQLGCVAYNRWPHRFTALSVQSLPTDGDVVVLTFWAWGNDDDETFVNLDRVIQVLKNALARSGALAVTAPGLAP